MKTFGKNSISSILRVAIDIMLITEVLAVLWMLIPIISQYKMIYGNAPVHNDSGSMKYLFFSDITFFIFGLVAILITLQLRRLLNAFKKEIIFEPINVKRIKIISSLIFLYVVFDFVFTLFRQYLGVDLGDFSGAMVRKMPITDIFTIKSIISAINFKLLFVSIVIYIIARVFQIGNDLKEETTLTI
jgi:hypothetical protein